MTQPGDTPTTCELVTVEPDLAEHVIDLLAAAGVPALDRPDQQGLITVVVRAGDAERARATLDLVLPGLLASDSGEKPTVGPGQGLSGRLIRRTDWPAEEQSAQPSRPGSGLVDGRAAFAGALGESVVDEPSPVDDGDYIPPAPPPLPRGDLVSRFAWLGAVGGPLLILAAVLLPLPDILAGLGLAGFIAGFGVLVARMPNRARQDDGWDDGAVL